MTIQQQGTDVVENGSGTLNLTALSDGGTSIIRSLVYPSLPLGSGIVGGPTDSLTLEAWSGISGPASFGAGPLAPRLRAAATPLVLIANLGFYLPTTYVSGEALSNTSTYSDKTIAGLGLTPGTYTWTWGTGPTADSFQLQVEAATPEPATFGLLTFAAAGMLLAGYRRR